MKAKAATIRWPSRHYNPDEVVLGKRMEDHLRFAIACVRSCGQAPTRSAAFFERPWFQDTMDAAKMKADVAFEFFQLLGTPYYCFHGLTFALRATALREHEEPQRDRRLLRSEAG